MWFFFNDGFVSVVAHRERPGELLVRSRRREILESLFPSRTVETSENADYRYRLTVTKEEWASIVADRIAGIEYPNFKSSIEDEAYHDLCSSVWSLHYRYQR